MIFLGLSLYAFGISYAQFKKHTQKYAKTLQSQALTLKQTELQNNIALRTPNPTLDFNVGRYDADFNDIDYGYAVGASQTIRTNGYLNALSSLSEAKTMLAKANIFQGRASYMKMMEETYTQYVYQNKLLALLQEEYKLSKKMTKIAKERYLNGAETRVSYLQAKTQTLSLKAQEHTTKQQVQSLYYTLLAIGGYNKKVTLSKKFIYAMNARVKGKARLNARQKILLAKEKLYASQLRMNENRFTSFDVSAGLEKEPGQSILRVGISIPLPLRNNKEEEKALSRLKMKQLQLDRATLKLNNKSQRQLLKANLKELTLQYQALAVLKKNRTLLLVY